MRGCPSSAQRQAGQLGVKPAYIQRFCCSVQRCGAVNKSLKCNIVLGDLVPLRNRSVTAACATREFSSSTPPLQLLWDWPAGYNVLILARGPHKYQPKMLTRAYHYNRASEPPSCVKSNSTRQQHPLRMTNPAPAPPPETILDAHAR